MARPLGAISKTSGDHIPFMTLADKHYIGPPQDRFHQSILRALEDECEAFAMMVIDVRGKVRTIISPTLEHYDEVILPREVRGRFEHLVNQQLADGGLRVPKKTAQDEKYSAFPNKYRSESQPFHGRLSKRCDLSRGTVVERQSTPAKRCKASATQFIEPRRGPADDSDSPVKIDSVGRSDNVMHKQIEVGDTKALDEYYHSCFIQLQQLNCKAVAKAWIKVVEPKKQSRWPYKDSETNGPPWWPRGCRHREPDHLKKPERLKLLSTMLQLCKTNTYKNLTVSKLQESTNEIINAINPPEKRLLLEEIYRVAKEEERYLRREIDASTLISVLPFKKAVKKSRGHNPSTDTEEILLANNGSFEGPEDVAPNQGVATHTALPIPQVALQESHHSDQLSLASILPQSNGPSMTLCDYQHRYPVPTRDFTTYMESPNIHQGTALAPPNAGDPALQGGACPSNPQINLHHQWPSPTTNGAMHGTTLEQRLPTALYQLPHPPPQSQPPMVQCPAPQAPCTTWSDQAYYMISTVKAFHSTPGH